MTTTPWRVADAVAGERLDRALALWLPELSLRGRRRLLSEARVLVDGLPGQAAQRLQPGQEIWLVEAEASLVPAVRLVRQQDAYLALAKPAGLPTAALAGGCGPSLEAALPQVLGGGQGSLLTRLDTPTSGLVLVALTAEAAREFRRMENAGQVTKSYLAVVHGRVTAPLVCHQPLDTARRATTRILPGRAEPLRQTRVTPLAHDPSQNLSLVRAVIAKGARHQIRAHLAAAGHPILGDDRYGAPGAKDGTGLYLHHGSLHFPGFSAALEPEWADWSAWQQAWSQESED